jgi:hypothetical protein
MNHPARALATALLLLGGCATVPRYGYAPQHDSASVGVGQTLNGLSTSPYAGGADVVISRIDGQGVGYPASLYEARTAVFVSPGRHSIVLSINSVRETDKNNGEWASTSAVSATGSFNAEFLANHAYRFTAELEGGRFEVTLWDETGGLATRSSAGGWEFGGQPGGG